MNFGGLGAVEETKGNRFVLKECKIGLQEDI